MNLKPVFHPESVAVIGASASFAKWGQMVLSNIVAGQFRGRVFPVNPREEVIFGLPVYRRIQDISEPVDLAIICTPAETVLDVLGGCSEKGVKAVVVITSGFSETGEAGKALERRMVTACRESGILLVGPNTMGILCPHSGLFATGTHTLPVMHTNEVNEHDAEEDYVPSQKITIVYKMPGQCHMLWDGVMLQVGSSL